MPTGHVKTYNSAQRFGFIAGETGNDVYVAADNATGELAPGALVEYEVAEDEKGRRQAVSVTVTHDAAPDNPTGRTMASPPSWDELEERERARRAARRRRR